MNVWTERKLRGDDSVAGAARCAAPRARFRSSVQRNRGVSDPGSGAGHRPPPFSGVAHATATRSRSIARATAAPTRHSGVHTASPRSDGRAEIRTRVASVRRQRGQRVNTVSAAIPRQILERCSPPSMRYACAPPGFARAASTPGGAASALTASARRSESSACGMAGRCTESVGQPLTMTRVVVILRVSFLVSRRHPSASPCRRTALRSPLQSAIRRPPRNINAPLANTAAAVNTTARGDRLSPTMPAHRPHPHC